MGMIIHRIYVGNQLVPKTQILLSGKFGKTVKFPRLLASKVVLLSVQAGNGGEHAELQPSQEQLTAPFAQSEAADVVAPPCIAYVGGVYCEVGLEIKGLPAYYRVAGEAQG